MPGRCEDATAAQGPGDVVVAPPLSETLLARLEAAGVARDTLPSFGDVAKSVGGRLALPEDILALRVTMAREMLRL